MKGAVLITLNDFVEENFGLDKWEEVLAIAKPASAGVYTSVQNYDDQEVMDLVHATCEVLGLSREQALRAFGEYLFVVLNKKYPIFTSLQDSLIGFLASVEGIVHKEVKKLFPDAYLPTLKPISQTDRSITLEYRSRRKMCDLAEGLLQGAANHYGVDIEITQSKCYCHGDDHCLIEVSL